MIILTQGGHEYVDGNCMDTWNSSLEDFICIFKISQENP